MGSAQSHNRPGEASVRGGTCAQKVLQDFDCAADGAKDFQKGPIDCKINDHGTSLVDISEIRAVDVEVNGENERAHHGSKSAKRTPLSVSV